jgi:hypothetical protein
MNTRTSGVPRQERINASPRWDGVRFRNTSQVPRGNPAVAMPSMSEFICGGDRRVPQKPLPSLNPLDTWTRQVDSGLRATWLGHSTVLIEIDGYRVLTDPVWGPRASPSRFIGPKRFPARARLDPRAAAPGCGHRVSRSLRPSRLHDHARDAPHVGAHRHVTRRRLAPGIVRHRARSVSSSSTGGSRTGCPAPISRCTRHPSHHFSGPWAQGRQQDVVVVVRDPVAAPSRVLQRRHGPHRRTRRRSARSWAPSTS